MPQQKLHSPETFWWESRRRRKSFLIRSYLSILPLLPRPHALLPVRFLFPLDPLGLPRLPLPPVHPDFLGPLGFLLPLVPPVPPDFLRLLGPLGFLLPLGPPVLSQHPPGSLLS